MLTPDDKARIRADFQEWSGGWLPHEAGDEVELYLEVAYPSDLDQEEVEAYMTEWANEEEGKGSESFPSPHPVRRPTPDDDGFEGGL